MWLGLMKVINTFQMAAEVEYMGKDTGFAIDFDLFDKPKTEVWPGADLGFEICSTMGSPVEQFKSSFRVAGKTHTAHALECR